MLRNYFKTTFRNFQRHLGYTFINVFGLSVGLAASIFILLWIDDELQYDQFHANNKQLYRVLHNARYSDGHIETYNSTNARLTEAAKAEVPEVIHMIRSDWGTEMLFEGGEKSLMVSGMWADPDFFKMFTFPIVNGNKSNPLPDLKSVVITEKMAAKFFAKENPIGKTFHIDSLYDMTVTAVCSDPPKASTLQFEFILPFERLYNEQPWMKNWGNSSNQSFVMLNATASPEEVGKKLVALSKKNCKECINEPFLQLYSESRLHSKFENGVVAGGRIEFIQIFAVVAAFVLLIASINFMNLSTARSATRSREVGVRKVIGANRSGLVLQFIGESLIISFFSLLLAVAMVQLMLPLFNGMTDKKVTLDFSNPMITFGLFGITLLTGILAGSYPAFFLSSFQPAAVLKGSRNSSMSGNALRKILVVTQFLLSTILIIASIVVFNQVEYIRQTNLGFDRRNVITFSIRSPIGKNPEAFRNEALTIPGVKNLTLAGHNPFDVQNSTTDPIWPGKPEGDVTPFRVITSDEHFIETLGMNLAEGRNFSGSKTDTLNYILNEAAVRAMGLKEPVGTPLEMWFGKGQIIGVVTDFHNQNFRNAIEPLIMTYYPSNTWRVFARLEGSNTDETLKKLEALHKKYVPRYPFTYSFLDDQFDEQYRMETTIGKLAVAFTAIAIFISCLGLFGLASFTAERRTKEIGVRKVMGASVTNLVALLCGDFTRLVVVALSIGCPIAYFMMNYFLSQYTFHTEVHFWVFGVTAILILVVSLLTVIFQSAKAAMANPVNSLRNE